uniref:Putative basic tail protein n=1 Tax=Ixodes ricinus TaxID=34613 RepID=A0A0K8R3I3_IXORI
MLAATIFTVIITTFGQITCAEVPSNWRCPDKEFDDPGYSLGCTYQCINGNEADVNTYWGRYNDGTVCVDLQGGDPEKFNHVGTCRNGECVQYKEANIEEVWRKLPETQGQFHDCNPKSNATPVEKCMHICKKYAPNGKYGYFFGIYQDYNACNVSTSKHVPVMAQANCSQYIIDVVKDYLYKERSAYLRLCTAE